VARTCSLARNWAPTIDDQTFFLGCNPNRVVIFLKTNYNKYLTDALPLNKLLEASKSTVKYPQVKSNLSILKQNLLKKQMFSFSETTS
jgi:hypothetical protein